jgi:hypothetical protein
MAKKGQHKNDAFDQRKSPGHNKASQSQTITTGTYKKPETYQKQAYAHEDPGKEPQAAKNDWNEDRLDRPRNEGRSRARDSDITSGRSGSDSNAS